MTDILAIITIILWPVVPLFWIPVHGFPKIFKRLGLATYIMPLITWALLVYLFYAQRDFFLYYKIEFPIFLNIIGIMFLVVGTLLHLWTGKLLGLWGLMGLPEISSKVKGRLVTEGPLSIVRHPTYLAHTVMFFGVFLYTEVTAVGIITLLDSIIINAIIIPLEDRELTARFGREYEEYKKRVRWRFFPGVL
ncbi:MAG: isoprenylcysteine carboxylmethyltransferase family protein [Nitrospirae bacterium]|nr:isoprenylcysteine carboxylmethyltransferase family protein [Nitrospirota bacterium]